MFWIFLISYIIGMYITFTIFRWIDNDGDFAIDVFISMLWPLGVVTLPFILLFYYIDYLCRHKKK